MLYCPTETNSGVFCAVQTYLLIKFWCESKNMTLILTQRVSVPDNVLMRELDGESVILDLASENYYGLDDIGTRMWQLLVSSDSVLEAYNTLLLEYEVAPQQLQRDIEDLVNQLVENELLRIDADQTAENPTV
jgi:hypothetical protein